MTAPEWRGPINQIVYAVMFERQLDDAIVERVVDWILQRSRLASGPQAYYDTLGQAIATSDLSWLLSTNHSPDAMRDFFRRVRDRLDKARPWPEPDYQELPISAWHSMPQHVIARIELTTMQVTNRLRKTFFPLPGGDEEPTGLVLRLRDGREVGLLGATGIGNRVTLLQRGEDEPAAVIDSFAEATGITREEITQLV